MEIGSEFSYRKSGNDCPDTIFCYLDKYQAIYTDSGRSALRLLMPLLPRGPILLPAYLCESVYNLLRDFDLIFYEMTNDLRIDWEDLFRKLTDGISVLYLHYFNGCLPDDEQLKKIAERKKRQGFLIVEDTTHSIFSSPLTVGDYGLCSLRKWFPIPDGGVLYSSRLFKADLTAPDEAEWVQMKLQAMMLKAEYLEGKANQECHLEYRNLFSLCDKALDEQKCAFRLSDSSRNILKSCSVSELINARRKNQAFLADKLRDFPDLEQVAQPGPNDCPLTCPVKVKERDSLRKYLISHQVYCAVHWPASQMPTIHAAQAAEQELSFPVDQRYGVTELSFLLSQLYSYRGINFNVEADQKL